jgi:hypothetical protein
MCIFHICNHASKGQFIFNFNKMTIQFFKVPHHFKFPPAMNGGCRFSTTTLDIYQNIQIGEW